MNVATEKGKKHTEQKTNLKKGDHLRCEQCGMEVQVTADCNCNDPNHVQFRCCGEDMHKV